MDSRIYNLLVKYRQVAEDSYANDMLTCFAPAITKKQYFQIVFDVLNDLSAREITMILNKPERIAQKIRKGCKMANEKMCRNDRREFIKLCYQEQNAMGLYQKKYC